MAQGPHPLLRLDPPGRSMARTRVLGWPSVSCQMTTRRTQGLRVMAVTLPSTLSRGRRVLPPARVAASDYLLAD